MVNVLLSGNPFKVAGEIVGFVAVLMVYLGKVLWVWDMGYSYNPVKIFVRFLSVFRKFYAQISMSMDKWSYYLGAQNPFLVSELPDPLFRTNVAKLRNLVVGEALNRFPHREPSKIASITRQGGL